MIKYKKIIRLFYRPKRKILPIDDERYYGSFGFSKIAGNWIPMDKEKLEYAYRKAWDNRDFEINKFWTRASYFWGFIALIFGAYITLLANDKFNSIKYPNIELYMICLGLLFSNAWYFVIIGSKRWQENWEAHIDKLENYISGPIYKTVHYKGTYYSVSKINEILSLIVIVVWIGFLINYLTINQHWPNSNMCMKDIDYGVLVPLVITFLFFLTFWQGYCKTPLRSKKYSFYRRDDSW